MGKVKVNMKGLIIGRYVLIKTGPNGLIFGLTTRCRLLHVEIFSQPAKEISKFEFRIRINFSINHRNLQIFGPEISKGVASSNTFFSRVNFQGVKKGPSQKTDFPVTAARGQIDLRILIYEVRFCEISLNYTIYSKNNR